MTGATWGPIDQKAARDVLGHFGIEGGWATGGFTSKLIDAICHADQANQDLIGLGFPELVHAVRVYQNVYGGIELLQAAAKEVTA